MTSMPDLTDEAAAAIVDATVPALGIPMAPEWRDAVVANVKATTAAAALVLDCPLDDAIEPAPVFSA